MKKTIISLCFSLCGLLASASGFAIYSADGRLLGYSADSNLDVNNLPPLLRENLANGATVSASAPAPLSRAGNEKILPTADWAQEGAFNQLTPPGTPSGCVATAMGIVMKYYNWPPSGTGSHSYDMQGQTLSYDFTTSFDFDAMQTSFLGHSTASASAISKLLYAAGVSVETDYRPGESGSVIFQCIPMARHFRYSPDYRIMLTSDYSDSEIAEAVRSEIDAGRPVLCSGEDPNGGSHAFVLDGYDDRGFIHVNWGWGGNGNGFYELSQYMKKSGAAIQTHIEPYRAELPAESINPSGVYISPEYHTTQGIAIDRENIVAGERFPFAVGSIYNSGADIDDVIFYLTHCAADGTVKETLSERFGGVFRSGRYQNLTGCSAVCNEPVAEGDVLRLEYSADGGPRTPVYGYGTFPCQRKMTGNKFRKIPVNIEVDPGITVEPYYEGTSLTEVAVGMSHTVMVYAEEGISKVGVYKGDFNSETITSSSLSRGYSVNTPKWQLAGACCEPSVNIKFVADRTPGKSEAVIHVDTPGYFAHQLKDVEGYVLSDVRELTVTGTLSVFDLNYMSWLTNLIKLDISGCLIVDDAANMAESGLPRNFMGGSASKLTRVKLPSNLLSIGDENFSYCNISEIELPATLTSIGNESFYFYDKPMMKRVTALMPEPCPIGENTFGTAEDRAQETLIVGVGCREKYAAAQYWSDFGTIIEQNLQSASPEVKSVAPVGDDNTLFDLMGRKVVNPSNGIYILNSKKIIIRK